MTLSEIQQSEWYLSRPPVIQQAIDILPPGQLYQFKDSGKQCTIYSYDEPESGLIEDVTVTVNKTGIGGALASMGLGALDTNSVFGVKLSDLEPWKDSILEGEYSQPESLAPSGQQESPSGLAPGWREIMKNYESEPLTEELLMQILKETFGSKQSDTASTRLPID